MISLHYFKYTYDLSDEDVVESWLQNPYWQYLSGMIYFQHSHPLSPSSMSRWRKRAGKAGLEELLTETINPIRPEHIFTDQGYRGPTPRRLWKWMKSRAAVEPGIGHLKTEHRLNRNQLRGWDGDMHNVILSAAGMNFHKLLKHLRQLWLSILRGLGRLLGHKTLSQMSMRLSKVILHAA